MTRWSKYTCLVLLSCALLIPAHAQDEVLVSPDRPGFGTGSEVLGAGCIQWETGFECLHMLGTHVLTLPTPLFRFGVHRRVELRMEYTGAMAVFDHPDDDPASQDEQLYTPEHLLLGTKIMRVGNLAARSYDGEFQVNFSTNSYMGRIKIFNMLGCCPYDQYDNQTEFSPIDQTAKAIVLLATTPKECTVFQPYNTHTRLLGNVLQVLDKLGTEMQFVEPEAFGMAIQQAALDPQKAPLLTTMLAYQNIAHGQPTQIVERNNEYTSQVLLRLGFRWTEPDNEYIGRMLTAISQLGFFDV